jgi:hypothetical protein
MSKGNFAIIYYSHLQKKDTDTRFVNITQTVV